MPLLEHENIISVIDFTATCLLTLALSWLIIGDAHQPRVYII